MKAYPIAAILGFLVLFCARPLHAQSELEVLKNRFVTYLSKTPLNVEGRSHAAEYLATQRPDGSWADIDYSDALMDGPDAWQPWLHLQRIEAMASLVRDPDSEFHKSPQMIAAVLRGLDYWFAAKPTVNHYWHLAMGRNLSMKNIVLLMEPYLTQAQKEAALHELYFAIEDKDGDGVYQYYYGDHDTVATGQNRAWLAGVHLQAALLKGSAKEAREAAAACFSVLEFSQHEGIQVDYSFLQHGPQLYNGGYGRSFVLGMAPLCMLTQGLPDYQPSPAQLAVMRGLVLQGDQWMIRGHSWDPLVQGREIARLDCVVVDDNWTRAIHELMRADPGHETDYQRFLDNIAAPHETGLIGHKHFWRADYTAHRRPGYSFSIKCSSERVRITETGNGENPFNMYEAQGSTLLLLDGDEYTNIFPCWHWDEVPGTTAPVRDPVPHTRSWSVRGTQAFVGGVSDGLHGVTAKDVDWDGLTARKAWFCFDNDIVALGAGIHFEGGIEVHTALNQTIRKSPVYVGYDDGAGDVAADTTEAPATLDKPRWVYQGGVGYYFPQPGPVQLRNQPGVTAPWSRISPRFRPDDKVTHDMFALMIPHGVNPLAARYAYTLLPAMTREQVRAYAAAPQSHILANTPDVQAVRNDALRLTGIVFWKPGRLAVSDALSVAVDTPCILLVDESGSRPEVAASRYDAGDLRVMLQQAHGSVEALTFHLPGGMEAGRTVRTPALRVEVTGGR